jgi:Pin2-interacting protein X1
MQSRTLDTNRFSYQHLAKFGWDPTQGLGSENNQGNREHIKVVRKLDSSGIGVARAMKEGAEIGGAGEGLNSLFARLKKAGSAHVEGAEGETVVVSPGPMVFDTVSTSDETDADANAPVIIAPEPRPLGNSSRSKYVRSKRLAASSPAAMAEILGIPISSLPASPSPLSQPPTPGPSSLKQSNSRSSTSEAEDVLDDHKITVAKISVGEYFRRRLAQRKAEREGGPVPEFDDSKPEVYNEVAKGFEGKKIVFGGDEDQEDVKVKMEVEEEEEAKQAERGVGGAGLGSAGDLNAVRSEATSPVPEVKVKKEKKDKKEKREKKDKEKKKDKGKQRANVEEGGADVLVNMEEGVEQARVKLEPVDEAEKKEKKKSDKKEKKEKKEKSGEKGEGKKRKRDDDIDDDTTSEVKKEKKAKKEVSLIGTKIIESEIGKLIDRGCDRVDRRRAKSRRTELSAVRPFFDPIRRFFLHCIWVYLVYCWLPSWGSCMTCTKTI